MTAVTNVAPLIDVRLDDPAWAEALPGIETLARETVFETLRQADPACHEQPTEISLMFTDDQSMQSLNSRYRGQDQTTNVLSFASHDPSNIADYGMAVDGRRMLGDVVLAFGRVHGEANEGGVSFSHHVMHLIAHGILHLLGHDHAEQEEAVIMEEHEAAILLALGVDNPYHAGNGDNGAIDHV